MSVGGLGLAGLSQPAVIIQQQLGGRQGSLWLIRAGLDARLDHFNTVLCASTVRTLHGTARPRAELMAQASVTETCPHERLSAQPGQKERHDSTISESK